MARVPERLRGQPAYKELRVLMREGLCVSAASRCESLCASPRVQALMSAGRTAETPEADALVQLLVEETASTKLTSIMTAASLRRLFPEGVSQESLTDRRILVAEEEGMSDSTLTRREFTVCAALLAALGISNAAEASQTVDDVADRRLTGLGGEWFALWETTVHGSHNFNMERVRFSPQGRTLKIRNEAPSPHNSEGYLWHGSLEAIQERTLVGSYSALEPNTGWSGTLFYRVGGSATFMEGRWVGANVDSELNSGVTVLAREQDVARRRFAILVGGSQPIPRLGEA